MIKTQMSKIMTFCLAVMVLASSANVYAIGNQRKVIGPKDKVNVVELRRILKLSGDFGVVFTSIETAANTLGSVSDPNPTTNEAIAGLLATNQVVVGQSVVKFSAVLRKLGVPNAIIATLATELTSFYSSGVGYILALNLYNTGQGTDQEQDIAALQFVQAGAALGATLSILSHNSEFLDAFTTITNLLTQEAQAWRLVLNDSNIFGANPSQPATETSAAIKIRAALALVFEDLIKSEFK